MAKAFIYWQTKMSVLFSEKKKSLRLIPPFVVVPYVELQTNNPWGIPRGVNNPPVCTVESRKTLLVCFSVFSNFPSVKANWKKGFAFQVTLLRRRNRADHSEPVRSCFAHGQKKQLRDLQLCFLSIPYVIYVFLLDSCTFLRGCSPFLIYITCRPPDTGPQVVYYHCTTVLFSLCQAALLIAAHLISIQNSASNSPSPQASTHLRNPECPWRLKTTGWMCFTGPEHQFSSDRRRRGCYY